MRVLVVGGGGREHAVIRKLRENPEITEIFALPGNAGMRKEAVCVPIGAKDIPAIVNFARDEQIDYAVVTPDDPLVLGCVDALEALGIPCFGPRANAAVIEGSKVFSKNLMKKYGIPTAKYESFDDLEEALRYLETAPLPTVVKADGLALGKGVIIAQTREEAEAAVTDMMQEIFLPTMAAMSAEGRTFRGCLYFGLMLTKDGPKVIEYNCRFGDPETQVVLPLLESDLFTVMRAVTEGRLSETEVRFSDKAACCVILASKGYPGSYEKGFPLDIPEAVEKQVYVAGAKMKDGVLVTDGGRIAGCTAVADSLADAIRDAYKIAEQVHFENAYCRRDIGQRALQARREQ